MNRVLPMLSKGLLIVGGLLIVAGLGWGIWVRVQAPPPPVITDEGAVVFAITAQPTPTALPTATIPAPSPTSPTAPPATQQATSEGPTPNLLPEWTVTQPPPEPTRPSPPFTPRPPAPTPTPTPTPPPRAKEPPTHVVAPAIELDAKVVPMGWEMVDHDGVLVSEWIVPKKAAGWHMNSALPGHEENVVLSGHHNIHGKVFRYIVDLNLGDEVTLYVGDTPYPYNVTEKYILKEAGMPLYTRKRNAQWILPTGDERLTLVTCWPYEWPGNSHRVIVVARPPVYIEAGDIIPK